ncbi:DNA replication ATP-dependent helicase/nuclease DNA2 [Anabrus simplex]|uniref:DNA replication ATP-dependent helicase/nuclease DNA2 n=1 Tax=Anabrus simplex TaxID=316456 RepID=UPI0035A29C60
MVAYLNPEHPKKIIQFTGVPIGANSILRSFTSLRAEYENQIPLQGRLDGFLCKPVQKMNESIASPKSSVIATDSVTTAHDAEVCDIEDVLTMKRRKKKQLSPEDGKVKRKLKLVNIKSFFSKQSHDSSSNVLRERNSISHCNSEVSKTESQKSEGKIIKVVDLTSDQEVGTIMICSTATETSDTICKMDHQKEALKDSDELEKCPKNSEIQDKLPRKLYESGLKASSSVSEVSVDDGTGQRLENSKTVVEMSIKSEVVSTSKTAIKISRNSNVVLSEENTNSKRTSCFENAVDECCISENKLNRCDLKTARVLQVNVDVNKEQLVENSKLVSEMSVKSEIISVSTKAIKTSSKSEVVSSLEKASDKTLGSSCCGDAVNPSLKSKDVCRSEKAVDTSCESETSPKSLKEGANEFVISDIQTENKTEVSVLYMFEDSFELGTNFQEEVEGIVVDVQTDPSQVDSTVEVKKSSVMEVEELTCLKSQEVWDVNSLLESEMSAFLDDWQFEGESQQQLDLSSWQRCKVAEVRAEGRNKLLSLCSSSSSAVAECLLKGVWTHINIEAGSIVSVLARRVGDLWTVDNEEGFLILYPDMLVSGTAVVGSLYCQRRGVLSDWFRGMDAGNKSMVTGSLIHELLQEVLKSKMYDPREIRLLIERMVKAPHVVRDLYAISMSTAEARDELLSVIPSIVDFIRVYLRSDRRFAKPPNWQGKICSIVSVEENYWISQLGLKGKVDISVEVQELGSSKRKMMPLELKTGRATNSIEHRGQVILYTLMAVETCPGVDAGLLLYLRENSITKIQVGRNEKRDIMCRRNELAEYLTISPTLPANGAAFDPPRLPEPINNSRACSKCPYLDLCSAFLERSGMDHLSSGHAMRQLVPEATSHLTAKHVDYLMLWTALVQLEEAERRAKSSLQDLWCKTPAQREARGKCLAGLVLEPPVMTVGPGCCVHTFQRTISAGDLRLSGLADGEMVLVSTDKRVCLAMGTILDVGDETLTVDFPRDLSETNPGEVFHIDAYESQGQMSTTLTCLGALFENSKKMAKLRSLIIDREIPMFDKTRPQVLGQGHSFLATLNLSQQQAVLQALAARDYLLVKGRPGAGKTSLVAALVRLLVHEGRSVLLTSHTHSAVDNVLLRLVDSGVEFLRLGSTTRIHDKIHPWAEDVLTATCSTPELLDAVYNSKPVVATTCHGATHFLFTRRRFDVCIVDESTQVLQPLVLTPLFHADKFILVGDPEQLPPVVKSRKAGQLGLSESLFVRLDRPEATVCLDEQYRMNSAITALANALTYEGRLKCANSRVADATVKLTVKEELVAGRQWIQKALSQQMEDAVIFLDTSGSSGHSSQDTNEMEADIVKKLLQVFAQSGVEEERMGVIAPYRAQVTLLKKVAGDVEVNTVDQYQGRDKDIIFFSCTKSWDVEADNKRQPQEFEILNDKRRLTVAITRAKHKLILIGAIATLKLYPSFHKLVNSLSPDCIVAVKELS